MLIIDHNQFATASYFYDSTILFFFFFFKATKVWKYMEIHVNTVTGLPEL